jgi:hypothetical protein
MQLRETITLSGQTLSKPLPRPAEELVELFAKNGFKFENLGDETLLLNEIYSLDRFPKFKELIAKYGLKLKIYHSIWTVYENKDYKQNPLWTLLFPEIFIDGVDFEKKCSLCSKNTVVIDSNKRVHQVKSKKPVVTVNGQFTIVKKELKIKMESELSGTYFEPFDECGEYFHLLAKSSLGDLINTPEDFIEYGGICKECNLPVFKMFFSALKYSKKNWNGDDIVSGAYYEGVFFTETAYKLLKSVEKEVSKYGVVVLK